MNSLERVNSIESRLANRSVTILGYYGAGNTGDEAILAGMIKSLQAIGISDITVLSRNPEATIREHQVKAVYTGRRSEGLATVYRTIRDSDLFILGGGGLLHDHTARVVPYWLSRVLLARIARTPIYFYAQGVGPINRMFSRFLIRWLVNKVDYITVRDQPSVKLLGELGIKRPTIELTADPALLLTTEADGSLEADGHKLLEKERVFLTPERINIAISLRPWTDEAYKQNLITVLRKLANAYRIHFVVIPFQYGHDEAISKELSLALPNANLLKQEYSPTEMVAILSEFDGIIGMRLHALILGAITNRPLFSLSYDDKVANFMDRIDLNEYNYSLEEIAQDKIAQVEAGVETSAFYWALDLWLNSLNQTSKKLKPHVIQLKQEARRNAEVARELLAQKE